MARATSTAQGGYYAFPPEHLPHIANLFAPAPKARLLDPCAGEGEALKILADSLKMTPYAIEIEPNRAEECKKLFGKNALQADMVHTAISPEGIQLLWCNPPFTFEGAKPLERREENMLFHSLRWVQKGGYVIFISYNHHLTFSLLHQLSKHTESMELYRLPEKHFGEYVYTVLIAKIGHHDYPQDLANHYIELAKTPDKIPHISEATDKRTLPTPKPLKQFEFHKTVVSLGEIQQALNTSGADLQTAFRLALSPKSTGMDVTPPMRLKRGHLITLIAAGLFNYITIDTDEGNAMIRSVVRYVEEKVSEEARENNESREVYHLRPKVTITLLYTNGRVEDLSDDTSLGQFLSKYRDQLFDYALKKFAPRYDIAVPIAESKVKQKWLPHMNRQRVKGKYPLFPAQLHTAAAICTTLDSIHKCLFVGEMSTGKTTCSLSVMDAWHRAGNVKPGQVMLVTCPTIMVKKWAREANQQLPQARVTTIILEDKNSRGKTVRHDMLAEFAQAMRYAESEPHRLHIVICSQDSIKLGEGWESVAYKKRDPKTKDNYLLCPSTGQRLKSVVPSGTRHIEIDTRMSDLEKLQTYSDDKRRYPLWQEVRKIGLSKENNGRAVKQGNKVISLTKEPILDEWLALKGTRPQSNPRMPLYRLVQARYKKRISILFIDESHQSQNIASDRYRSISALARCSSNVVGLSGTIFNGYASSLYGLETIFNPDLFKQYEWGSSGVTAFTRDMGVLERVIEHKQSVSAYGAYTGTKRIAHAPKEIPGASPLLIQMIMNHTVFLALKDMGKALPKLDEIPMPVSMSPSQGYNYERGEIILKDYLNGCRKEGDASFLASYYRSQLSYPDTAFMPLEVIHNKTLKDPSTRKLTTRTMHVHKYPAVGETQLPKEDWLIDLVQSELEQGRGVGIYVTQTDKRNMQPRIMELLKKNVPQARPVILTTDVKGVDREEWIQNQFEKLGSNVLITNPRLVEVGLDIVWCPTLVFIAPEPMLSVLAQSARRHWRIPQKHACKTYFVYYEETMEQKLTGLIAKKLQSLAVVNGESASLSALSQSTDLLQQLIDNAEGTVMDLQAEFALVNDRTFDDSEWLYDLEASAEPVIPEPTITPNLHEIAEPQINLIQLLEDVHNIMQKAQQEPPQPQPETPAPRKLPELPAKFSPKPQQMSMF